MIVGFTPSFGAGGSLTQWRVLQNNLDRQIEAFRDNPVIARDIAYARENLPKVETPQDLLDDFRLYSFAMKAYGLESQIFARGLMDKVFSEPLEEPDSTVNQLVDRKYREIAAGFRFNSQIGPVRTGEPGFVDALIERFVQNQFETAADGANPAIRFALYFERKAPEITDVYQLLADPALARVARTIANLPPESARIDIDTQAKLLERRIDLEDFKDPEKLGAMIDRFLAVSDIETGGPAGPTAPVLQLFGAGPPLRGIDGQTLLAIASLPR